MFLSRCDDSVGEDEMFRATKMTLREKERQRGREGGREGARGFSQVSEREVSVR
jgi:hypothetical protein